MQRIVLENRNPGESILMCPCGSEHLHHCKPTAYTDGAGHGYGDSAVSINFWCEECATVSTLCIRQHEGETDVAWTTTRRSGPTLACALLLHVSDHIWIEASARTRAEKMDIVLESLLSDEEREDLHVQQLDIFSEVGALLVAQEWLRDNGWHTRMDTWPSAGVAEIAKDELGPLATCVKMTRWFYPEADVLDYAYGVGATGHEAAAEAIVAACRSMLAYRESSRPLARRNK